MIKRYLMSASKLREETHAVDNNKIPFHDN